MSVTLTFMVYINYTLNDAFNKAKAMLATCNDENATVEFNYDLIKLTVDRNTTFDTILEEHKNRTKKSLDNMREYFEEQKQRLLDEKRGITKNKWWL